MSHLPSPDNDADKVQWLTFDWDSLEIYEGASDIQLDYRRTIEEARQQKRKKTQVLSNKGEVVIDFVLEKRLLYASWARMTPK